MPRLTKRAPDGAVIFPDDLVGLVPPDNPTMCGILTRLADYEDTGKTPQQIVRLAEASAQSAEAAEATKPVDPPPCEAKTSPVIKRYRYFATIRDSEPLPGFPDPADNPLMYVEKTKSEDDDPLYFDGLDGYAWGCADYDKPLTWEQTERFGLTPEGLEVRTVNMTLPAEEVRKLNRLMQTLKVNYEKEGIDRSSTVALWTANFEDGYEMDLKVSSSSDWDEPLWCETVLFRHGCEAACSDVWDDLTGAWDFSVDGKLFVLNVSCTSEDEEAEE